MITDQTGALVPQDLVVLAIEPGSLSPTERSAVVAIDWYHPTVEDAGSRASLILVSSKALEACVASFFAHYTLADAGLKYLREVDLIERDDRDWNANYFYHA